MLHSIDSVTDVEAVANAVNTANVVEGTADVEETTYTLDDLHPEGDFNAKITDAKEVKGYIMVDFETNEGWISKFYSISKANGKIRLDPSMRYLLNATGVKTSNFALSSFVGKTVTATVTHYEKDGETRAGVGKIQ